MGFFSRLFKIKNNIYTQNESIETTRCKECEKILNLNEYMYNMLLRDEYIAKSEYRSKIEESKDIIDYFNVLKTSGLMKEFCKKNSINIEDVENTINSYENFVNLIDNHNEIFIQKKLIEEKNYLDNILKNVDPNINLDDEQRRVVLTDEDYCLVIAGAGAGKTTTMAAKVKYLIERKNIDPKQILVVSFTNKSVKELQDKINKGLKIDCPISTFHSVGNAILRKQTPDKLNIFDSIKLYYILQDYFKKNILKNESLVNNLILFFASYFDAPYEGDNLNDFFNKTAKSCFTTMRSNLEEFRQEVLNICSKRKVTIQNEVMRSNQEVEIANFLYLNNIDYQYEPLYKYDILLSRKPYTPDFFIKQGDNEAYIEHFGITQDGKNNRFSDDELETYKKAINDKIKLHHKHGTKLIYTFSHFNDKRELSEHLKEELEKNGFILKPKSNQEVMTKLVNMEETHYIRKLVSLVCRFIANFKANGYTVDEFSRMYSSTQNVRTKLFLNICNDCYLEYSRYLKENNAVDFEDMINESARILREVKSMKQKLDFKYIIVDEYQDISRQRFDLVTALSEVTDAKIIAVGDDWQSIYAFSGSDITLFTKFAEKMGYAKLLKIVQTYRNSQEVIDIAGNFIQKNKTQITKQLISPKRIINPVIIYTYDNTYKKANADNRSGANYNLARAVEIAIEQIIEYNKEENKPSNSSILLLGRFGFDADKLERSGLFEYTNRQGKLKSVKYPYLNITYMTAHASKGLGYDNVIIINGRNETYGFPSKIEDDPVLSFVIKNDRSIEYAEERRLFYVAMTRTKNRVYFIAPSQNPSEFLLELKHDYKNVILKGSWNENTLKTNPLKKRCPICGYPLQYRYKNNYGLPLFICTNEPEICGFMTNKYGAGKLSIIKCDKCRDGYLIAKKDKGGNDYFLGCTNYKKDGTGCNNSISRRKYYEMMNFKFDNIYQEKANIPNLNINKDKEPLPKKDINKPYRNINKANINSILYKGVNLNEIVYIIISCNLHISEHRYYGVSVLVDVLRGSKSNKIINKDLNEIPEYGQLTFLDRNDLIYIIEWCIDKHFILKTKHPKYPVLHPTYEGMHYDKIITEKDLEHLLDRLNSNVEK